MTTHEAAARGESEIDDFVANATRRLWPDCTITGREPVTGDASSRAYLRYSLSGGTGCPRSVVVMAMQDASVALSSDELGVFGKDGPGELPFLNVHRFLSRHTDSVPHIFCVSEDSSLILLEDVGDTTLWAAGTREPENAEHLFASAIALIAELQRTAVDDGSGCYAFRQRFDERLFLWEFDHFIEYGTAGADVRSLAAARAELETAACRLASMPVTFCHRDFHAWNIHVEGDRIRIIDFQDALLGPPLYDVASLLTDRTTPELIDPTAEQRLIAAYLQEVSGKAPSADELETALGEYRLVALQRALKVVGRFNYLAEIKGKKAYLKMLPAAAATAKRMLADLPSLQATRSLLTSHGKTAR